MVDFRNLSNALLERVRWFREAGLSFDDQRDMYATLGYPRILTVSAMRQRYERGGIAGRVIDAFPNATWRGQVELIEDEDPKSSTPFEQAWLDLDKKHQVQAKLQRADKLAGLSTFAVLLIGAEGELEGELPKGDPDKLLYLTPFLGGGGPGANNSQRAEASGADASVFEYEIDPKNARFGLPKSYTLKRVDITGPALSRPVHWTRIIHIAEGVLDDDVYGTPRLQRVWNLFDDLDKVTGGGSEAFWLRANQGLHVDVDKDMPLADSKETIAHLKEQSEEYKHQMTRWLRTRGVSVQTLGSDVANFSNPADAVLTQISGALAIPKRILTGSEMGELASSQDRDNWKDQINGRQTGYAGPYIVRPLVDRLILYGYLPAPKKDPTAYEVRWPNIQVLTEDEKATGAQKWAGTKNGDGTPVFFNDEIRDKWYGMAPQDETQAANQKKLMESLAPPPPEEPEGEEPEKEEERFPRAAAALICAAGRDHLETLCGRTDTETAVTRNQVTCSACGDLLEAGGLEALEQLTAALERGDNAAISEALGLPSENTDELELLSAAMGARDSALLRATHPPQIIRVEPVTPTVIVNLPEAKHTKKTYTYGLVDGHMRVTGVKEEEE